MNEQNRDSAEIFSLFGLAVSEVKRRFEKVFYHRWISESEHSSEAQTMKSRKKTCFIIVEVFSEPAMNPSICPCSSYTNPKKEDELTFHGKSHLEIADPTVPTAICPSHDNATQQHAEHRLHTLDGFV